MAKKKKKVRSEEVETFIDRATRFVHTHNRWFVAGCGFFLVIGALIWGYQHYTFRQNEQAAYAYNKAVEGWKAFSDSAEPDKADLSKTLSDFIRDFPSHPLSTLAEFDRLILMAEQGNWASVKELGLGLMKKISPGTPLYPILLRHIAFAYEKLGDYENALKTWELLAENAPDLWHRDIFWHLGRVLEAMGKGSEAEKYFQKALEAEGVFPPDFMIKAELNQSRARAASKRQG